VFGAITATGGGGGGSFKVAGNAGGSGGGGAGAVGGNGGTNVTTAGNGGAGLASTITGTSVTYGGGGGVGNGGAGGQGGAGIVIVRYQGASLGNIGGTVTSGSGSAAGYTLQTFTTTGTSALNLSSVNMNARFGATLTGSLSGAGGLTYNGPGTLTLTGSNTYNGGTALLSGTLALGSAAAIGSTGTISFGGGTLRFSAANTTDYSARFSTAANQAYALDTNAQSVTLASALAGPGASLTKLGTGTLALAGGNSFTAGTVLGGGVLRLGAADALGSTGPISFVGGTLQFTAANTTDYSARFSTANGQAYALDTNGQNANFATSLSSMGGSLTKAGAGTLTLTGTVNLAGSNPFETYDEGTTRVTAGTLVLPGGSSLAGSHLTVDGTGAGPTAAVVIDGGSVGPEGTRDFPGPSHTVGSAGVGDLTVNSGTLSGGQLGIAYQAGSRGTTTVNGGSVDISGVIAVGNSGAGTLLLTAGSINTDYALVIGNNPGASGTMTMTGGTLTSGGADNIGNYIGNGSTGVLQMSGGRADFSALVIGIQAGGGSGTGTLTVTGGTLSVTALAANQGRFMLGLGNNTAGTVTISDAGVVNVMSGTGTMNLAADGNSSGVLNIGTGGRRRNAVGRDGARVPQHGDRELQSHRHHLVLARGYRHDEREQARRRDHDPHRQQHIQRHHDDLGRHA
jgi:autotransporter-associated beta strand protein